MNVFGNYTVQHTALKGVRIGLGAQIFGERLIANQLTNPFDYIYDDAYYLVTDRSPAVSNCPRSRCSISR